MPIQERKIQVGELSIHIAEAGDKSLPAILFVHGFPESWQAYEEMMEVAQHRYHCVAFDLPGIGGSDAMAAADSGSLAHFIHDLLDALALEKVTIVGHDVGTMITYTFIKQYPERLHKGVLMDAPVPGCEPWDELAVSPYLWHFPFFATPELPEALVQGREAILFDHFYNVLSDRPTAVKPAKKEVFVKAYQKPGALTAGFNWYRAFPKDVEINKATGAVDVPVLYLKGAIEQLPFDAIVAGLRQSGLRQVQGIQIPDCGHYGNEERPAEVMNAIDEFINA